MMKKILFISAVVMLLDLTACCDKQAAPTNSVGPNFDEVLMSRRSIRSYDATKTITKEEVQELLAAVQEAPSWATQQPTK